MLWIILLACQAPVSDARVLTGWSYAWSDLSHRISVLRVDVPQEGDAELALVGGSYTNGSDGTDTPNYAVSWSDIAVPGATYAEAGADWVVGPDGRASATLEAPAPEGCDGPVALLNGFGLDTGIPQSADYPADYDPALGYTSNGFGFAVGEVAQADGALTVDVTAEVRWGVQDRDDMNAAIPHAQTGVYARVLFVCGAQDLAAAKAEGNAAYAFDPPFTEQPTMTAALTVEGGARDGVAGLTGFALDAAFTNVDGSAAGDYLRAFGVGVTGADDGHGAWTGTATGTLSNSSAIEYGQLDAAFSVGVVRVGRRGAQQVVHDTAGSHAVGSTTVDLR